MSIQSDSVCTWNYDAWNFRWHFTLFPGARNFTWNDFTWIHVHGITEKSTWIPSLLLKQLRENWHLWWETWPKNNSILPKHAPAYLNKNLFEMPNNPTSNACVSCQNAQKSPRTCVHTPSVLLCPQRVMQYAVDAAKEVIFCIIYIYIYTSLRATRSG